MKVQFIPKLMKGAAWTVVATTGNRAARRAGTATESAPLTVCTLTLAQAQATAASMRRDAR
jgi:hypothetical protein